MFIANSSKLHCYNKTDNEILNYPAIYDNNNLGILNKTIDDSFNISYQASHDSSALRDKTFRTVRIDNTLRLFLNGTICDLKLSKNYENYCFEIVKKNKVTYSIIVVSTEEVQSKNDTINNCASDNKIILKLIKNILMPSIFLSINIIIIYYYHPSEESIRKKITFNYFISFSLAYILLILSIYWDNYKAGNYIKIIINQYLI